MSNREQFNEAQKGRLRANFKYADKLLLEVEEILTAASSSAAFPKYKNSLSPTQVRVIRDYMTRIRRQMLRVFADLDVPVPPAQFDSVHSIRVTLQFVQIALEECAPERLVGYGHVAESLTAPLTGALQEMKAMVDQLDSYVAQGLGRDLEGRLQRLSATGDEVELVRKLRDIIDAHGLVEFRSILTSLVEKLESPAYEISVFGRVSSGKSSLLNRIIGIDALPVGVTPVTAVPTRIRNGQTERLCVWFAAGRQQELPIQQLDEFVTEEENPSNAKQVTKVLLEIASPRLPAGVTLVDTPGLGSLALGGAAETLAYLPRCDLGVVVIDASSSLAPEDIGTVQKLYEAATPAIIVLSKVDLLNESERGRLVEYTKRKIQDELGVDISVKPLSSRAEFEYLIDQWMKKEIAPRYAQAQQLAQDSLKRKAGALRDSIVAVLEAMSGRSQPIQLSAGSAEDLRRAETRLRLAAGQIETARNESYKSTDQIRTIGPMVPAAVTEEAISRWKAHELEAGLDTEWVRSAIAGVAQSEGLQVVELLRTTAKELTDSLETASRLLPASESDDLPDLRALIKDMPIPAPDISVIAIKRPSSITLALGLARWQVRRKLKSRTEPQITAFFSDYGRLLELWVRSTLSDLEHQFEQRAENYRAQLQRITAVPDRHRTDLASVEASLASLKAFTPLEQTRSIT